MDGASTPVEPPAHGRSRAGLAIVGLAALIACGLVAAGLLWLAMQPRLTATPATVGRIAIVDASGELRTTDADGGDERRYDQIGPESGFPAWSPDGHRLAVVGLAADEARLYVLDDDQVARPGSIPDPIYASATAPPFYLYWSPDGRQVTFLTTEVDSLALRTAPADGSAPDAVVRRGAPMYWAWTGVDHILVHAGGDGPDAYVGELGLDGLESRRSAVVPGRFQAPAVSADGRRRAYVTSTAEAERKVRSLAIVVEDGDGATRQVPVDGPTALGWSPAAGGLAFIAPRGGLELPVGALQILDPGAAQPRMLLDDDVVAFFWAPDGSTLAALALPTDTPTQVASLRGLPRRTPAMAAAGDGNALRLAIVDADDGAVRLDRPVQLSETFLRQVIPFFDQYGLSHRLWSGDAASLVLPLVDDSGRTHVTIVPADGESPRVIGEGEVAFWGP